MTEPAIHCLNCATGSIHLPDDMARLKISSNNVSNAQLRGNPKPALQLLDKIDDLGL